MYGERPGDVAVLAAAASLAPRLSVLRALEWSVRLRQAGVPETPPLLTSPTTADRSARDRVVAAAVAAEAFDLPEAWDLLPVLAGAVPDAEAEDVLGELRLFAPRVAESFVRV